MKALKEIGVLDRDSSIILEILTKDAMDTPLDIDHPVTARIDLLSADGVKTIDNVTLNTADNGYVHQLEYPLSDLEEGTYEVTYIVSVDGVIHEHKETFKVIDQNPPVIPDVDPNDAEGDVDYAELAKYVLPPEFQVDAEIEVEGNKVHLQLSEELEPNHKYTVIITDDVRSLESQSKLDGTYNTYFTSAYEPLYASPLEVKSILKDIFFYFSLADIYEAIRDAGQKAHQLLRIPASAQESGFAPIAANDSNLFPAQKFSVYQASIQLLNQLIIKIIYANEATTDDEIVSAVDNSTDSFSLGDFQVSKNGNIGDDKSKEPVEVAVLERLIEANQSELQFWTDALMGRNARRYANPMAATNRGGVTAPESRDI